MSTCDSSISNATIIALGFRGVDQCIHVVPEIWDIDTFASSTLSAESLDSPKTNTINIVKCLFCHSSNCNESRAHNKFKLLNWKSIILHWKTVQWLWYDSHYCFNFYWFCGMNSKIFVKLISLLMLSTAPWHPDVYIATANMDMSWLHQKKWSKSWLFWD